MLSSQLACFRVHVPSRVDTQDREYNNEYKIKRCIQICTDNIQIFEQQLLKYRFG